MDISEYDTDSSNYTSLELQSTGMRYKLFLYTLVLAYDCFYFICNIDSHYISASTIHWLKKENLSYVEMSFVWLSQKGLINIDPGKYFIYLLKDRMP